MQHQPRRIGNQPEMLQHTGGWRQHLVTEITEILAGKQHDPRRIAVTQQVQLVELPVRLKHPVSLHEADLPPL